MPKTLQEFLKNKGFQVPTIQPIKTQLPSAKIGVSDVLKEVPSATGKTLRWVGKQLMKPVGVVATGAEQIGKAIGEKSFEPLKEAPKLASEVIIGKRERSFADIWRENLPGHQIAGTIIGTVVDIAADPLNLVGGIATKGLALAEKGIGKVPLIQKGLKPVFSAKVGVKEVDALIDEYKSLGEFRKAQVIEGARDVQKTISKLPDEDIIKVSNYIEKLNQYQKSIH